MPRPTCYDKNSRLSAHDVRALLAAKGVTVESAGAVAVLAIRGYQSDENERGIYDDAFYVVLTDRCVGFNGNTDPSAYRKGIATLNPGIWTYIAGKHHVTEPPPRGYPAFRQYGKFTVTRDGQGTDEGDFAINNHKGGVNGTSSLGCQTVPPSQWGEYRKLIYGALGTNDAEVMRNPYGVPDKTFKYVLITRDSAETILGRSI